jgi:type IV pilus assembly protein PilO
MNLTLEKKELMILLSAVVLVVLILLGGYYLYLNPKKAEVSNKEAQLQTEEQLLAAIQTKVAGISAPSAESVAELQKKVPVKQQLEQLILDLNKAEVVSESFVSSMSFSEGAVAPRVEENAEAPAEGEQPPAEGEAASEAAAATEETTEGEQQPQPVLLPEGIKKLNVSIAVKSPGYKELMKFLEALESLNRRVVIESVAFSGDSELTSLDTEKEEMSYSLTLAAFYMPELEDLQDKLPELEVPAPGNKVNPFATSADIPED